MDSRETKNNSPKNADAPDSEEAHSSLDEGKVEVKENLQDSSLDDSVTPSGLAGEADTADLNEEPAEEPAEEPTAVRRGLTLDTSAAAFEPEDDTEVEEFKETLQNPSPTADTDTPAADEEPAEES